MDFRVLLSALVLCGVAKTCSGGVSYKAAVFEHRPRHDALQSPRQVVESNLRFFEKAVKLAAGKKVDIIVFNEFGLFPYDPSRDKMRPFMEHVPDPKKAKHNPCAEVKTFKDRFQLSSLSCLARENQVYIVANVGDVQPCSVTSQTCEANDVANSCKSKCPADGVYMYNTNVVFDKAGNLVARYHKVYPYFEAMNVPTEEEDKFGFFDTDFGRFGLSICFDTAFEENMVLARDYKIDAMLFPTHWFDKVSSWATVEWQQSWAIANRVDFLASNSHTPGWGVFGSGIYSKDSGAVVYTYDPDGESKLLVASLPHRKGSDAEIILVKEEGNVPKKETGAHFEEYCDEKIAGPAKDPATDFRCHKSHFEDYHLVKLVNAKDHLTSCDGDFCCSLKYVAEDIPEGFYLAVRNYTNENDNYYYWCEETCVLIRCDPSAEKLCYYRQSSSNVAFKSFEMKAKFTAERIYPTVSKDKYRLAPKSEWQYKIKGEYAELKFKTSASEGLLKAGLYGRCYQRDPPFLSWYDENN